VNKKKPYFGITKTVMGNLVISNNVEVLEDKSRGAGRIIIK